MESCYSKSCVETINAFEIINLNCVAAGFLLITVPFLALLDP